MLPKFEVRSFTGPEIIGGIQKISAVSGYTHAPFSPEFLMGFCSDGPCEYCRPNLPDWRFWENCEPQCWEDEVVGGRG